MNLQLIRQNEFDKINQSEIETYKKLSLISDMCRLNTLTIVKNAGSGHLGSSLSSMDIFVWLYYKQMNLSKLGISHPDRDIFFSSKGHDVPGLYSVLYSLGIIPEERYVRLRRLNGIDGHPDIRVPGIEANSGSLGMGISKAKGMAWAKQYKGYNGHVFVMTGDGEFQEGQNFEALQSTIHQKVKKITVIMDHNKVQSDKAVSEILDLANLEIKISAFGWTVLRIDGNDFPQIAEALQFAVEHPELPVFIIADTLKGKGVSFMEHPNAMQKNNGLYPWHAGAPDNQSFESAFKEIHLRIQEKICELNIAPVELVDIKELLSKEEKNILNALGEPISQAAVDLHKISFSNEYIVEAYGKALQQAGEFHPELIVLDADLSSDCRLRFFENSHPEQFIENGIAEQDMVSMAGGLARQGLLPVVNSFASFLASRANEQIYNNATEKSRIIYGFHYAGLIPAGPGKSHQSIRDISLIKALPNFEIIQPCNARETASVVDYCINHSKQNCVIRMNISPSPRIIELPDNYTLTKGEGITLRGGSDAILFAYGPVMLHEALLASEILEYENFGLKIVNLPWLNCTSAEWFLHTIQTYRSIFVLEDHSTTGGLGESLFVILAEHNALETRSFKIFGIDGYPECGTPAEVLNYHRIKGEILATRIQHNN